MAHSPTQPSIVTPAPSRPSQYAAFAADPPLSKTGICATQLFTLIGQARDAEGQMDIETTQAHMRHAMGSDMTRLTSESDTRILVVGDLRRFAPRHRTDFPVPLTIWTEAPWQES